MSKMQSSSNEEAAAVEAVEEEQKIANDNDGDVASGESQETQESEENDFDPKRHVEFSTPEQQKKFNDVYKQMRMSDNRNKMLTNMLEEAVGKIDELKTRFNQTDHAEAERILTQRLKEARDAGDEEKADKIFQEIVDFKVDSKIKEKAIQNIKPQQKASYTDEDVQSIVRFAEETDESGKLRRPWISQNHPDHLNAMRMAGALALQVNAEMGYPDVEEVMKRMDDAMKSRPKALVGNTRAPDPMRGNLTNQPAKSKIKLSPQEIQIAKKLGVKPEDYLKWK